MKHEHIYLYLYITIHASLKVYAKFSADVEFKRKGGKLIAAVDFTHRIYIFKFGYSTIVSL